MADRDRPYYPPPGRNYEREMGEMQARLTGTEERLERIEKKVDTLIEFMAVAKGGAGMLYKVGTISAASGAIVAQLVHWFWSLK